MNTVCRSGVTVKKTQRCRTCCKDRMSLSHIVYEASFFVMVAGFCGTVNIEPPITIFTSNLVYFVLSSRV